MSRIELTNDRHTLVFGVDDTRLGPSTYLEVWNNPHEERKAAILTVSGLGVFYKVKPEQTGPALDIAVERYIKKITDAFKLWKSMNVAYNSLDSMTIEHIAKKLDLYKPDFYTLEFAREHIAEYIHHLSVKGAYNNKILLNNYIGSNKKLYEYMCKNGVAGEYCKDFWIGVKSDKYRAKVIESMKMVEDEVEFAIRYPSTYHYCYRNKIAFEKSTVEA